MRATPPGILIATLHSKPQLVTLALDCLSAAGDLPTEVVVVHTDRLIPPTAAALKRLDQALPADFPNLAWRSLELCDTQGHPLPDVTAPDQVRTAFTALYAEVQLAKLAGKRVHLLIAGGRRTLTVFGMATAQLLFDAHDRLWHLASHPALEESSALHARPGEWKELIPIPVVTWGWHSPVFEALRDTRDPFEAAEQLRAWRLREQWDEARIFIMGQLSPAEREVVELLARDGLSDKEIAERLVISPRTVEHHLREAYRKAADQWELEDVNRTQLVRRLAVYFAFAPCPPDDEIGGKPA